MFETVDYIEILDYILVLYRHGITDLTDFVCYLFSIIYCLNAYIHRSAEVKCDKIENPFN